MRKIQFLPLLLLLGFFFCSPTFGSEKEENLADKLFLEVWNGNVYRETNFSTDGEEDYLLSSLSLQSGLRFTLMDKLYLDPYISFSWDGDWLSEDWNKVYWNNNVEWGPAIRLSYEYSSGGDKGQVLWLSDFNIDLTSKWLFREDSPDNGKDRIPSDAESSNLRTRIGIWTAVDSRSFFNDTTSFIAEAWTELGYNTAFGTEETENYYPFAIYSIFGFEVPLGKIFIQPYYAINVQWDLGSKSWNKEPWLNNVSYGPGLRFSMGNLLPIEEADLYFYGEYLQIDYFSRVEEESYAGTAGDDIRLVFEIRIPFGATKDRLKRH